MLVYGDPQHRKGLREVRDAFRRRIVASDLDSLDEWRVLLIEAGQIEQALADHCRMNGSACPDVLCQAMRLTDCVAKRFCQTCATQCVFDNRLAHNSIAVTPADATETRTILRILTDLEIQSDPELTVKIPEGFAFYALFPEQYYAAALAWAKDHKKPTDKKVLIVGIRSIGTTLSAVVAKTLCMEGWRTVRTTVRPVGHPFEREMSKIPRAEEFRQAIVVDEGPGISGSSMASVAMALEQAGVEDVSFFPGHDSGPGLRAGAGVRELWARIPSYIVPLQKISWNGATLKRCLCAKAQEFTNSSECFAIEDLSGGEWRRWAYADEADWPAVAAQFERMKFRCTTRSGKSVLWKFAGLGGTPDGEGTSAEAEMAEIAKRAEMSFAPKALGVYRGFMATEWCEGKCLRRKDGNNRAMVSHIGEYIVQSAKAPLLPAEAEDAKGRLREMAYWNVREALGQDWAERIRTMNEVAERPLPTYGDGHLAPEEWIRARDGRILKTDCEGHHADHTVVGKQSILWDVAGALVEWDLRPQSAGVLLVRIREAGICVDEPTLNFYEIAYSAFRMGLMSLGMSQTSDAKEKSRLKKA